MNKGKPENLVSLGDRPESERKQIASLGGIASGEARRRKKELKRTINELVFSECEVDTEYEFTNGLMEEVDSYSLKDFRPKTVLEAIAVAIIKRALDGDIKSIRLVIDALGSE